MAEIVGLGASIIAIGGAAATACKISRGLYRDAKRIKGARKQIQAFAKDVQTYGSVVGLAHSSLQQYTRPTEHLPPILVSMKKEKVLDQLVEQSNRVVDALDDLKVPIKKLRGRRELWTRIKWMLQKAEVEALGPLMERVKTNIQIVISIVALEMLCRQANTEQSSEIFLQIKLLCQQVKAQMESIAFERKQDQIRFFMDRRKDSGQLSDFANNEIQGVLLNLGEHMVDRAAAAASTSANYPSPNNSITRDSGAARPLFRGQSLQGQSPSEASAKGHGTRRSPLRPVASQEVSTSPNRLLAPPPPPTGALSGSSPPPEAEPGEQIYQIDDRRSSGSSPQLRPIVDGDFSHVHGQGQVLDLTAAPDVQGVNGFITTPNGFTAATALLVKNFDENIISQAFAAKLRLVVDFFGDEEKTVWVKFEDGHRHQIIGHVVMKWCESDSSHRRPFPVHCLVFRDGIRNLIFGRNFVQRRDHYWGGGPISS